MNKYTKKGFLLHSRRNDFKIKVEKSLKIIKEAFDNHNCYVSFSGGKDSTVLTHLCLNLNKDVPVWHWDYGDDLMPRPIESEVLNNLESLGAVNIVVNKRQGDGADTSSGYKQFFGQISNNKKTYDWNMGLIGVRREESNRRKHKYKCYFQDGECYPLLDWSSDDVWAYIVSNDLPYSSVYDYYGEVMGWDKCRFVTFFDPEFDSLNIWDGLFVAEYR